MRTYHNKCRQSPTLEFKTRETFTVKDGQGRVVEKWEVTRSTYKDEGLHYFQANVTEFRSI